MPSFVAASFAWRPSSSTGGRPAPHWLSEGAMEERTVTAVVERRQRVSTAREGAGEGCTLGLRGFLRWFIKYMPVGIPKNATMTMAMINKTVIAGLPWSLYLGFNLSVFIICTTPLTPAISTYLPQRHRSPRKPACNLPNAEQRSECMAVDRACAISRRHMHCHTPCPLTLQPSGPRACNHPVVRLVRQRVPWRPTYRCPPSRIRCALCPSQRFSLSRVSNPSSNAGLSRNRRPRSTGI
jgi:hypothetical protein